MEIEALNLFVEVVRHRSFVEVARDRGVASSSIEF
jgi:DNA-binding transcriptional LysR family regulator